MLVILLTHSSDELSCNVLIYRFFFFSRIALSYTVKLNKETMLDLWQWWLVINNLRETLYSSNRQ